MIKKLLILSLIVIPFYEVFLYFCIPERGYPTFSDLRVTKDFIMLVSCLAIGSFSLLTVGFKPIKNVWIPAFILFLVWNIYKSPEVPLIVLNNNINRLWNFEPFAKILCLLLLFCAVSSQTFTRQNVQQIFKVISYAGIAMAGYMFLQFISIDQIFDTFSYEVIGHPKNPSMGGTIGQATISAPFIVMCLPFTLFYHHKLISVFMSIVVVLSGSSFAILGLFSTLFAYLFMNLKNCFQKAVLIFIAVASSIIGGFGLIRFFPNMLVDNGRFSIWFKTFNEFITKKIEFTGAGIGAYPYLFSLHDHTLWRQAHNEYLQLLWSCGIIGFAIAFMMLKNFMQDTLKLKNMEIKIILVSFIGIGVISLGCFPLQLAVYQFYLVVMAAIVYSVTANKEIYYEQS